MKLKLTGALIAAALLTTGCDRVDPNSPLGKRKAIYQQMLDEKEEMGGMLRERIPFKPEAFAAHAVKLDALSREPWQHYPAVKEAQSDARDEVWQRQERFQALADELMAATAVLAEQTRQAPPTATEVAPPFQAVEDACERCHEEFRAY